MLKILSSNTSHFELSVNVQITRSLTFSFRSSGGDWKKICALVRGSVESKNGKNIKIMAKIQSRGSQ
jgi:hypothetical protein